MEVKASVTYDLKIFQTLRWISFFQKNDPKKKTRKQILIAIPLMIIFILYTVFVEVSPLVLGVAGVLLLDILQIYLCYGGAKSIDKAWRKNAGAQNQYIFKDDEMFVSTVANGYSGNSTIKYSVLFKAMETNEYMFLYENETNCYVVDKSTVTDGTAADIRLALATVLKDKYITCDY